MQQFIESICCHTKDSPTTKAGEAMHLLAWHIRDVIEPLYGWHDPAGLRRFRIAYIEVPKKNAKALCVKTPVATPLGWVCQGDLAVGDEVFAADGSRCRVIAKTPVVRGRPCYRVTFSDGESIVADEEHFWYTESYRTGLPRTGLGRKSTWHERHIRTTKQIRDTLTFNASRTSVACNHRVPVAGAIQCHDADLLIDPYVLGCWLGDGTSAAATITCSYNDLETIENLRDAGIKVVERKSSNETSGLYSLDANHPSGRCHGIHTKLRKMGLLCNKHIPAAYLRASYDQRLSLLQGLMDTDGTACITGTKGVPRCEFATTSSALRDGALELIRSLGYKPTVLCYRAMLQGKDCGEVYRVCLAGFRDTPPFKLRRKLDRLGSLPTKKPRSQYRQIVSVDPVESVPVCCIQVNSRDGLYLAGRGMIPTHNSTLLSCLSIWHLLMEGHGELGCIAAKDRNQAAIIFDETAAMVKRSPELKSVLEVIDSRKTIFCAATGSSVRVISRDAGAAEGPSYSFVFCDELHAWPDRKLFEALRYSGRSRPQPLLATITTAGDRRDTICWEQHEYAEQVIADPKYDPRFYGKIFAAKSDGTDDYFDPAVWRRCNPGMGITMTEESFAADAQEAKNKASKLNGWLRYSLGVWTESSQRWLDPEKWAACSSPPPEPFAGRKCIIGMDLSKTTDLSAMVALYPYADGTFDVDAMFWAPRDLIMERERTDRQPFQHWVNSGFITATDGNVIDHSKIREYVKEYAKTHEVCSIRMDESGAVQLAVELQGEGFDLAGWSQGFRGMTSPTRALESLVLQGRIRHGGNPVLSWMAANVTVESNAYEDVRPVKKKSTGRIDGIVALIFALGEWEKSSVKAANPKVPEILII